MRQRLDDTIDISSNPALFGGQRRPGLVHVCTDRNGVLMTFRRDGEEVACESVEGFRPYLWLADPDLLDGLDVEVQVKELEGDNNYRYLVTAEDWSDIKAVSEHIATLSGRYASHPRSPQLFLTEQTTQYLLATGQTYYNSMAIEEVKTLALKVYTVADLKDGPGEDPDEIVAVALKDGAEECVVVEEDDESKLLWRLRGKIRKIDPDLIIGHDLFKRDLELLKERCRKRKVKLDWGRTDQNMYSRRARMVVAEKQLEYRRWKIPGREMVDSWILSILHDVSGRELMGYELEDVAEHFGLAYGKSGDSLAERAAKDINAIATIHRSLLYPYFLQSQLFPLSFSNVVLRGNATRINYLFLREYYRLGHSIPEKPEVENFEGGLTAQEHSGCAYGVYHCDVASLYPSLIIAFDLGPEKDRLNIFTGLLETLRDFRFLAKDKQKHADTELEQAFFQNLQTTFKILINSFYGYLGFGQGHFGDFDKASEVTRRGRELLRLMMDWIKQQEGKILEVDTDGVYFVPSSQFADNGWIEKLNDELPEGVQVEFDGRYPGMYCHKMKNYALLEESGELTLRGSGLRSRALEPYLRSFIEDLIRAALTEGPEARQKVLADYEQRLKAGEWPLESLLKTETLIDSPATYSKKIAKGGRNRAAVYELALASERRYRPGERISYYVTGDKATVTVYNHCKMFEDFDPAEPDVNHKYYVKKLKATFKKFDPILGGPELRSPIPFEQLPAATH